MAKTYLAALVETICHELGYPFPSDMVIDEPPAHIAADYSLNVALLLSKGLGQSPREVADHLAERMRTEAGIKNVEIAGPGFLNVTLQDSVLLEAAEHQLGDGKLGVVPIARPRKVIIDYGGPNVAKPLHVGHLRSAVIGQSLKNFHRYMGHTVYGDVHLGDWGTPMGMLIAIMARRNPEWPYFDPAFSGQYPLESPVSMDDLQHLYPEAAGLFKTDLEFQKEAQAATAELQSGRPGYRALWQHFVDVSKAAIKDIFEDLGVDFEWWYGESHYHDRIAPMVERLKKQGQAEISEGALVIPLTPARGSQTLPPFILTKSDGAFLYSTTDLAAIEERVWQDGAEAILYVVDQRQSLHFSQVFQAARQTGIAPEKVDLVHLGFGTVNGPDGKPFKTRDGGAMRLEELVAMVIRTARTTMEEAGIAKDYTEAERETIAHTVGIAALKFADLINNRTSDYIFDVDRFVSFEGKTGPYILYTAVRIQSIFRKLAELGESKHMAHAEGGYKVALGIPSDLERRLLRMMIRFPEVVEKAYRESAPHVLCEYCFELCQQYNAFYHQCPIISEKDQIKKESWIALSYFALRQMKAAMGLLGIEIPSKM